MPNAAHFIYIPGILILGVVIGWFLGSSAAADAYAAQMRKAQGPRPKAQGSRPKAQSPKRPKPKA
jgi:hypothetical protein